jgi:hypothetical protein
MSQYLIHIKKELIKLGAIEIHDKEIQGQPLLIYKISIDEKVINFLLFHSISDDESTVIIHLQSSFSVPFDPPEKDFYQILEKLNYDSIMGNLFFVHENDSNYIAYRSNYIGTKTDIIDSPVSFDLFLSSSYDMYSMFDSELNL